MMLKIVFLVLFSLICASDQYELFSYGYGRSRASSSNHPYSCTYDWFHRSKLNEVVGEPPRRKLVVLYYGNNFKNEDYKKVNLGDRFIPHEVKYQPYVWWRGESDKLYTLVMFDPDPNPKFGQIRHWLVVNIKGNNLNTGDSITDYLGAGTPAGTGDHRYTLLIYEQKKRFKKLNKHFVMASTRQLKGRAHFNVKEFAKKHGLGKPLVGNYFVARTNKGNKEEEAYVEKWNNQLEDDMDEKAVEDELKGYA